MKHTTPPPRFVDGLVNPRVFHRPIHKPKRLVLRPLPIGIGLVIFLVFIFFGIPQVQSFARQFEVFELLGNGRYLVLFQNDAEIRPSGGFIGSFAVVEAKQYHLKPLYFETNIYKLDNPFTATNTIPPPKPLQAALGDVGWALRDANFAADFRQAAETIKWFFKEEVSKITGPKRLEIQDSLGSNLEVDGVIATTLSAFLDILELTGPIEIPTHKVIVNRENFFSTVQQIVERDYFLDPKNKETNEPKTILQDLFPLAMERVQKLPRTTQYKLATKLLNDKKILVYSTDAAKENILIAQGWGGALTPQVGQSGESTDFLGIIRSSHGGNKSSLDIHPIYRYQITSQGNELKAKLDITFEHTGKGEWPSGVNHEYLRVLTPSGTTLQSAFRNGQDVIGDIDVGQEMDQVAFGFWLHTEPQSSQSFVLTYTLPRLSLSKKLFGSADYSLQLFRQPGGNDPDVTATYNDTVLYQGPLSDDQYVTH